MTFENREHDLGKEYTLREYHDPDTEVLIGYIISWPAAPQCKSPHSKCCGGLCAIRPYTVPLGEKQTRTYSVWVVTGEWPYLTFSPSIACECGGQHSFIQNGIWL